MLLYLGATGVTWLLPVTVFQNFKHQITCISVQWNVLYLLSSPKCAMSREKFSYLLLAMACRQYNFAATCNKIFQLLTSMPADVGWPTHLISPLSRTTRVSQYQKGRTNLHFTEARDSEWQWHQLGHMQVCTSLQTAAPDHSVFYRPDALRAAQPTAWKHWRLTYIMAIKWLNGWVCGNYSDLFGK